MNSTNIEMKQLSASLVMEVCEAAMSILPPSPFISSEPVETLPVMASDTEHHLPGRNFPIDEDSFFYAIDPPPLPEEHIEAIEIEHVLRALFARTA